MNSVSRVVLAMLLAGLLACSLQGCGSKEAEKKTTDKAKTDADKAKTDADEAKTEADKAKTDADKAKTDADKAKGDADKADGAADKSDTKGKDDEGAADKSDAKGKDEGTAADKSDAKGKDEGTAADKSDAKGKDGEGAAEKATVLTDANLAPSAAGSDAKTLDMGEKALYMLLGALIVTASYLTVRGIARAVPSSREVKVTEEQTELPELSLGQV